MQFKRLFQPVVFCSVPITFQALFCVSLLKGELRPEIVLLHMKVLTLIKAKSIAFP